MVEDSCDRCEKYDEDCLACRTEKAFQTIVNRRNLPPDEEETSMEEQKRLSGAMRENEERNLHPEDAGVPRIAGTAGHATSPQFRLPPSKRFPQGMDRIVRIMGQGVPEGDDKKGVQQLRPSFAGTPFATDERQMKNPAANIFRRGNPMKIAWRLLKNG